MFGKLVATRRLELELTQVALAKRVGRSESWVGQVERGERTVERLPVLALLAAALEMDPRDLLPEEFR